MGKSWSGPFFLFFLSIWVAECAYTPYWQWCFSNRIGLFSAEKESHDGVEFNTLNWPPSFPVVNLIKPLWDVRDREVRYMEIPPLNL